MWGAATFLSGLARSYGQLFTTRALVGIGEASYGPTASAMVSDLFPRERRGFVNALFNAAIPLGGAIGVIAGGLVGSRYGWRAAFLAGGPAEHRADAPRLAPRRPAAGRARRLPVADRSRRARGQLLRGRRRAVPHADLRHGLRGRHAGRLLDRRVQPLASPLPPPGQAVLGARGQLLVRRPARRRAASSASSPAGSSGISWRVGPPPGTSSPSRGASCSPRRPAS